MAGIEHGIDVAQWNGDINWKKVKSAGVTFGILKVTKKTNAKDPKFERNYEGCLFNDMNIGGYRYVYATSVDAAKKEADSLLKALGGRKMNYGIWLDMEDASLKKLSKTELSLIINTEAKILREGGYDTGIYCNKDWYKNVLDTKNLVKSHIFWIAGYGANTGIYTQKDFNTYRQMQNVIGWQYSSKFDCPGCDAAVDGDVTFGDWNFLVDVYGGSQ